MRNVTLASLALLASACGGDDSNVNATCTGSACVDAGGGDVVADAGGDVVIPTNCDLSKDISDSPACVDDGVGVFVSPTGDDNNPGTKASPFKTITNAIAKAGIKPRVYVCEGTYAEDVSLTQANAVNLYGGLACADWSYSGKLPVVGKSRLALGVDSLTKPLVIADILFQAADGANPGDSSIAALVNASADVTLRRVSLVAGKGKDGQNGAAGSNWTSVAQSDASIAGHDATGTGGGPTHTCSICTDGVNSGGAMGGGGTLTPSGGAAGTPNLSGSSPNDGAGGSAGCTAGHNGTTAANATAADGAKNVGVLSATGWASTGGDSGKNGGPGQGGGGGGGGSSLSGGGGGGGGCGGCGGAGATAGGGGGGSIALASIASNVTLVASQLTAGAGAKGGNGAAGQAGQLGGYGGQPSSPGCTGGIGGVGGAGGASGGGAGGVSVGVMYSGTMPTIDDATTGKITIGQAGAIGVGGVSGTDDGVAGLAVAVTAAP